MELFSNRIDLSIKPREIHKVKLYGDQNLATKNIPILKLGNIKFLLLK